MKNREFNSVVGLCIGASMFAGGGLMCLLSAPKHGAVAANARQQNTAPPAIKIAESTQLQVHARQLMSPVPFSMPQKLQLAPPATSEKSPVATPSPALEQITLPPVYVREPDFLETAGSAHQGPVLIAVPAPERAHSTPAASSEPLMLPPVHVQEPEFLKARESTLANVPPSLPSIHAPEAAKPKAAVAKVPAASPAHTPEQQRAEVPVSAYVGRIMQTLFPSRGHERIPQFAAPTPVQTPPLSARVTQTTPVPARHVQPPNMQIASSNSRTAQPLQTAQSAGQAYRGIINYAPAKQAPLPTRVAQALPVRNLQNNAQILQRQGQVPSPQDTQRLIGPGTNQPGTPQSVASNSLPPEPVRKSRYRRRARASRYAPQPPYLPTRIAANKLVPMNGTLDNASKPAARPGIESPMSRQQADLKAGELSGQQASNQADHNNDQLSEAQPTNRRAAPSKLQAATHWLASPFRGMKAKLPTRTASTRPSSEGAVETLTRSSFIKSSPDSSVYIANPHKIELRSGDVVIATKVKMDVFDFHRDANITISRNAIAVVTDRADVLQIQNLDGSVCVVTISGIGNIPIEPGRALCLSRSKTQIDSFMRTVNKSLPAGNYEWKECPDGKTIMTYDFSPADVASHNAVMQAMQASDRPGVKGIWQLIAQAAPAEEKIANKEELAQESVVKLGREN